MTRQSYTRATITRSGFLLVFPRRRSRNDMVRPLLFESGQLFHGSPHKILDDYIVPGEMNLKRVVCRVFTEENIRETSVVRVQTIDYGKVSTGRRTKMCL